jgi:hypothetical protein
MPPCGCQVNCNTAVTAAGGLFLAFGWGFFGILGLPSCRSGSGNIIVNAIKCLGLKPANNPNCVEPNSCFYWDIQPWTICSDVCGSGSVTRIVQCVATKNLQIVGDGNCPQPKPITAQTCNTQTCNYRWGVSTWTSCSKTCGKQQNEIITIIIFYIYSIMFLIHLFDI